MRVIYFRVISNYFVIFERHCISHDPHVHEKHDNLTKIKTVISSVIFYALHALYSNPFDMKLIRFRRLPGKCLNSENSNISIFVP